MIAWLKSIFQKDVAAIVSRFDKMLSELETVMVVREAKAAEAHAKAELLLLAHKAHNEEVALANKIHEQISKLIGK